jgi:predicted MFS family arabinose efflux permease
MATKSETTLRGNTGFMALATANLLAHSAEQIALAAAPLIAVIALGAGGVESGALQALLTLPFLLFAIPAGMLADRISRRSLMISAEMLRFASLVLILALSLMGQLNWLLLAILGSVGVCGTVLFSVAAPATVPALVPAHLLSTANARIELARTTALTAGPAIGGLLVSGTGAGGAFGLAAGLSLLAAGLLVKIAQPVQIVRKVRKPLQEIRDGMTFVFSHRLLAPIFATQFVFNVAFFIILAVFVPHAIYRLGLSPTAVGTILGMFGFGMVIGAMLAPRVIAAIPFGTVVAIGPVFGFAGSLAIVSTTVIANPMLAGLGFFLLGAGPILWIISTTTLRQSVTPPELLGRVSAINTLAYGARPIGAGIGALISGMLSIEAALFVASLGFAIQVGIILLSPAVKLERQPVMAAA